MKRSNGTFWLIFKQCATTSRLSGIRIKPSRHFISQKAKTDLWVVVTVLDVHLLSLLAFWCSIHTVIQFGSLHTSGKESKVCIFSCLLLSSLPSSRTLELKRRRSSGFSYRERLQLAISFVGFRKLRREKKKPEMCIIFRCKKYEL